MISQKYIKNSDLQIFPPEIQAEKKRQARNSKARMFWKAGTCPPPEPKPYNTLYTTSRNGAGLREAASTA